MQWWLNDLVVPWDSKNQFYAFFRFLASSLHSGATPFWNPYHYAGHPSIADPQSLIFSPAVLIALFDPSPGVGAVDFYALGLLAASALAILAFFIDRGWHPVGGVVAAIAFSFGASAAWRIQHIGQIQSYAFFGIALWLLARALDRRSIGWGIGDDVTYALEASVFVTGAAIQWLRDGLGLITEAAETEELAASLDGNDEVYFVPALTGLGSPYWDPYARGTIVGLTRGTGRAHIARAALEAIAFQTVDAVRAQELASGKPLVGLKADGGAVSNHWLMQFQADVLDAPVALSEIPETTALGAAYMAGVGTGFWSLGDISSMWKASRVFEPDMDASHREHLLEQWSLAVGKSRGWALGDVE